MPNDEKRLFQRRVLARFANAMALKHDHVLVRFHEARVAWPSLAALQDDLRTMAPSWRFSYSSPAADGYVFAREGAPAGGGTEPGGDATADVDERA